MPTVQIGEGAGWLRLYPVGAPHLAWPTRVTFKARCLEGELTADFWGVSEFVSQLEEMHGALSGKAHLGTLDGEGDVKIDLQFAGSRGDIGVNVVIRQHYGVDVNLTYAFKIDQSYLPRIIGEMQAAYPKNSIQ